MPPIVIRGDDLDIEVIQDAIRARVALREQAGVPVAAIEVQRAKHARLKPLDDWNFPRETWAAMWPPNLRPWNLDQDFPIRSHRAFVGRLLVAGKRGLRAVGRALCRPLLTQQVEINRALALMTLTLAREVAAERLHRQADERRLARVGVLLRELRGDAAPIVRFEDAPGQPR